ncbi:MAG: TonB-dependent receptor [Gemmatimonadales bacterium]|nr:TonB-dependent receptor [Gemmatimonadales bacterium]
MDRRFPSVLPALRLVLLPALCSFPAATSLSAQAETGRIVGKVVEAEGGAPLSGARVVVVGTTLATTTKVDGRYALADVPVGSVTVRVAMIGYGSKTVTGVVVTAGGVTTQDVSLAGQTTQLEELTVTARVEQGTVNSALDNQRYSVAIVNAISSEQMSRSPDGDAAAALQRMSGATIQDGKYLNMRGLGDRYTQASLNGARIPSPEPERRVVPLDLFPSSLLSEITTSKTFTPDQAGDFSGGSVDIKTKEFSGTRYFGMSFSAGFNTAITGKEAIFAPATGRDWIAFGSSPRALPNPVAAVDFSTPLTTAQNNELVNSFRNVWSARQRSGSPNGGFGLTLGGNLPVGGTGLSYLISGSYSYTQETRKDEQRAIAQPPGTVGGEVRELDRFDGSTGRSSALWGGIGNFSVNIGAHTKLSLNNTYNRTMDNEGRFEHGTSENLAIPLQIQRLRYVERNIYSSQMKVHQQLTDRHYLDFGLTASGVRRKEPDRSEIVYESSGATPTWYGFSNEAAVRTFANLKESTLEGSASWQFRFGSTPGNRFVQIGALYRATDRDAENHAYSISLARQLSAAEGALQPEQIFDGRFSQGSDNVLRVSPLSAGGSYTGRDRLTAAYGMLTLELSHALELIAGARVERSDVRVASRSTAGEPSLATPSYTDVLPSLALNFRVGENVNLRLSGTQTLSRPEYRELSPILFREVIGGDNVKGNPDLQRALIRNLDLRWEWYPRGGEVVSVGIFAKQFSDPIERIYQGTSGTRIITYVNARGADNYGVELEFRHGLDMLAKGLTPFTLFANATIMKSKIRLDADVGSITNAERKMVGQAPYVFNAGLTWKHPNASASATLLFNRVGERITEAGELPLPDIVERPRNVLDASIAFPVFGALNARMDAKNLLDAPYRLMQGVVIRDGYRSGRVFSIGFSWKQ